MPLPLLGGLSPGAFLRRHWQKRPLLVRGAIPGFRDPITPAGLLDLAARPGVESRLVLGRGGRRPWQVVPGPLPRALRRRLAPSHWTVLVQGVDAHVPAVADIVERFDFLPRWRVDDVMISLAAPQGSVGPHVDSYDVFLLQGRGRRRWRIARRFEEACRTGLDLRILRRFRAEDEWVLGPGDMLYLPPGVAHHGIALEECLTYSIGFRAPAEADLVAAFLHRLVGAADRQRLYRDPDLAAAREPGEISPAALARLRAIVVRGATVRTDEFVRFAGEHLTEARADGPKRPRRVEAVVLGRALRTGAWLERRLGARVAFVRRGRGAVLFADGRAWPLPAPLAAAAPVLTRRRRVRGQALVPLLRRAGLLDLLAALVSARVFRLVRPRAAGGSSRGRPRNRAGAGSPRRAGSR
jgi:50S ribosomal protein L16 3-hydroxylase